ncbi:MAG: RluA family pseudouridine synthase [Bryobacteraceae bacterium]
MTLHVPADAAGLRLDHFLQRELAGHSRAFLQEWIRAGRVKSGDRALKSSHRLRGGEVLEVDPADRRPLRAFAEPLPIAVLYEDAAVIAVDKPAGMVVHAGAGVRSGTLVNALLHRFQALSGVGGPLRPGIVHRLDRFTSGVVLVARDDAAHRDLAAQFASRRVRKIYLALVHGRVPAETGRIDAPIERDPARRVRMSARRGKGRAALTEYRVLRRWKDFTLLEVVMATGRTHQIRVHLSLAGHPVAGDRLYGAPAAPQGRFVLHAHTIGFRSPATGKHVTVTSPLPADLEAWSDRLER